MADVSLVQALNRALRDALRDDSRALVLGEDVGRNGGVFRVTEGLQGEFGEERVFGMCHTARPPASISNKKGAGAVCARTMTPSPAARTIHMSGSVQECS